MSDVRKHGQPRRGRAQPSTRAEPTAAWKEDSGNQEEQQEQTNHNVLTETQSPDRFGETNMADNARETFETARDSFKQGAEEAKDSIERGAGEVTSTLGRIAEIGTEYVRRSAEVNIDAFQKMATEMLNLQSKTAEWMRGTPFAPLCEAQVRAARKFVEATANSSRNALQNEAGR